MMMTSHTTEAAERHLFHMYRSLPLPTALVLGRFFTVLWLSDSYPRTSKQQYGGSDIFGHGYVVARRQNDYFIKRRTEQNSKQP